jgi:hypothetical protein
MTQRYPLAWPAGKPRTPWTARKSGAFKADGRYITVDRAFQRIQYELDRIGGRNPLVSTNVELRVDGRPRMDRAAPSDPGVCLYFDLKGQPYALACDVYQTVPQNLAAIAAHLEATRAIERHGVATAAEMFTAFVALPQPKRWWEVLGLTAGASLADVEAAWRAKAGANHPDRGGSHAAMAELNAARDAARRALA